MTKETANFLIKLFGVAAAFFMTTAFIMAIFFPDKLDKPKPKSKYGIAKLNAGIHTKNKQTGIEFFRLTGPDTDCIVLVNVAAQMGAMAMDMRCK